ncbi:DUF6776 family protein [Pseudidiomarina sp.]|uniref:DUF6776 family protein n=1 Tax=Pseudidiomarina sp. TaxID=2081707 RepID=UPI00299D0AF4|nr:DUF6776 family protein [Pseudidiomarina sp.]MDX1706610.1 DUF6776 family protein [Pseudidiomarina sp.]
MNEKQKIPDLAKLNRSAQVVVLAGMLVIGSLLGYLLGNWHVFSLQNDVEALEHQVAELYDQTEQFDYQQHMAKVELGIEQAASKNLQQELLMAQDESFALRRELTFYQKIMAPELEANGVVIDSLELQQNRNADHYHFRLAIVQTDRQRNLANGKVSLQLRGRLDGAVMVFDLQELANIEDKDRNFSMRYFTVQAGDFVLPQGFLPERIDVEVELSGSDRETLTRSFYWSQLLPVK